MVGERALILALGLLILNNTTTAAILAPVTLHNGDATLTAQSSAASTVTALPFDGGVTSTNIGVGAAVALALITDTTSASLADGVNLSDARNLTRPDASKSWWTALGHAAFC